jgi:flagellar biosynthetic protein FlhB
MTADTELDRSEAATPYKLEKARGEGQAPRSVEVVGCAVFFTAMAYAAWEGLASCEALFRIARGALGVVSRLHGEPGAWYPLVASMAAAAGEALLAFVLALWATACVASVAQTRGIFSLQPLRPDWTRLHPGAGCKRLWSLRTLFDAGRAVLKLLLLTVVAIVAFRDLLPQFQALAALPPGSFLRTAIADIAALGLRMAFALACVAALDLLFTRREFGRRMRMSRRELKDEMRHREGDPRIRARLAELRRELLKRSRALRNTRNAQLVLANPTHYAVALRYAHGEMEAPRVVAKGAGQLALAMREIAARHRIVVVENPLLARRLFREAPLDQYLPPDFHGEVARLFVWVLAARERAGARGAAA